MSNCIWRDVPDSETPSGWRKVACVRCGFITGLTPHPHGKIFRQCTIPGWSEWIDHFALLGLGIGRDKFAFCVISFRFMAVMIGSYFGHFAVPGEAGSTLGRMLRSIGGYTLPGENCQTCDQLRACMDADPAWCITNFDHIVDRLRESAAKRRLPFCHWAARLLVRRAIAISFRNSITA